MSASITVRVSHPTLPDGDIEGFNYLWAYYVDGYRAFDADNEPLCCQRCFHGERVKAFSKSTVGRGIVTVFDKMAQYPFVYICGGGAGPDSSCGVRNLHLPLRFAEGKPLIERTYNGYVFEAVNAEIVDIPLLGPEYDDLPTKHRRCKNFRFAVTYLPRIQRA